MLQRLKNIVSRENIFWAAALAIVSALVLILTWGKMPMGDNTTELAYGQMIRSGLIPYRDFYIHIFPLTSYFAALVESLPSPIRILSVVGAVNLAVSSVTVFAIAGRLKLDRADKLLVETVFFGLYLLTIIGFNHHPWDITAAILSVYFLLRYLQAGDDKRKASWLVFYAFFATITMFLTQHTGLAMLASAPTIILFDIIWNKNRGELKSLKKVVGFEALFISLVFLGFILIGRIPAGILFKSSFVDAYSNYGGTYGHWGIWRDGFDKVEAVLRRAGVVKTEAAAPSVASAGDTGLSELPKITTVVTPQTDNKFLKIFLVKSGTLYSIFDIFALSFVIFNFGFLIFVFGRALYRRQNIDPVVLVWGSLLATFFLSSFVVYQINFSNFILIFVFCFYTWRDKIFKYDIWLKKAVRAVFFASAGVLIVSNFTMLGYEFATREYLNSLTGPEKVWLSPYYYHGFVRQFAELKKAVKKEDAPGLKFDAYPRASEIFYLLGKPPQKGTPMASFFWPGGNYGSTLKSAENSDILVIYRPNFYGQPLGDEHDFAMSVLDPTLRKNFKIFFESDYFTAYKRIEYGK